MVELPSTIIGVVVESIALLVMIQDWSNGKNGKEGKEKKICFYRSSDTLKIIKEKTRSRNFLLYLLIPQLYSEAVYLYKKESLMINTNSKR